MAANAFTLNFRAVSPWLEMGAYEALWDSGTASFKSLASRFASHPGSLPSDFIPDRAICERYAAETVATLRKNGVDRFGVRLNGAGDYPPELRDAEAKHRVEMLYFRGFWSLVETRCVAVVGTRKPSSEGSKNAHKISTRLSRDGFTIVSGLADGIDTIAHGAAIVRGTPTIAVIGMPLFLAYPKENAPIQNFIAKEHLLISQVPVCSYEHLSFKMKPTFFPERNVTMSALCEATIIVEASDTSGTLSQARAALKQGRKLFILESCFRDKASRWPRLYESRGAIRVKSYHDILKHLG
jgi:DNA processing protein